LPIVDGGWSTGDRPRGRLRPQMSRRGVDERRMGRRRRVAAGIDPPAATLCHHHRIIIGTTRCVVDLI
jgi:hypothetical protein